ncbi:MAG: dehydrogenase subunit [Firmicutes bacterium]|nr:dehydrogenase subunit [Bacillota bacterium]
MSNCNCCCSQESKYFEKLESILKNYEGKESDLIPILQDIQAAYGYLPEDVLNKMCEKTGMFQTQVMGVATFYSQFRLQPTGEHVIKICFGTACHVNGAEKVADALADELKVKFGGTTEDGKFTLETVACLGCCSLAPVIMIDEEAYGRLTPDSARNIIREYYATGRA